MSDPRHDTEGIASMHEQGSCEKRDKPWPLPPSFPIEAARVHPRYKHYLEPGARCELDEGHEGAHRNGCLIWHDPPVIMVGGEVYEPPRDDWTLPLSEVLPNV